MTRLPLQSQHLKQRFAAPGRTLRNGLLAFAICVGIGSSAAFAEQKPECNPAATPPMIEGTVTAVSNDRITVRLADGSSHEFQVGKEVAQGYKVGDQIKARLRSNPKCDK